MPVYFIRTHTRKKTQWNHKGVIIYLSELHGKKKLLVYTPVYKTPRYFATLPAAKKAIDTWEKKQYKRDRRSFD